jgi:integrase
MLTDRQIQAAIKTGAAIELNDGAGGRGTGSLRLRIKPTAAGVSATWFGFWKTDGRKQTKALGRYPDLTLRDARDKFAVEVRSVLQKGKNPRTTVTVAKKPTVQALFEGYLAGLRESGRVSVDQVERALLTGSDAVVKALGSARIASDVDPADVSAYLAKVYRRGSRVAADRTRAYIAAAFNWAIKSTHDYRAENRRDWGIKQNPAAMVKRDSEANQPRERNLSAEELRQLWQSLDGDGFAPDTAAAIRLLILCGQRVRETLRIESHEIDLVGKVWNMPAAKSKIRRQHAIPLPDQAVPVLSDLITRHGNGQLLPARAGKGAHLSDAAINRSLARWCQRSGVARFQARDLRRTWKSRAGDAGVDRFTRDLIQQHQKADSGSKHYDRHDYFPQMRAAMDRWSEWLKIQFSEKQTD